MANVYFGLRSKQKETFDACVAEKFGITGYIDEIDNEINNVQFWNEFVKLF